MTSTIAWTSPYPASPMMDSQASVQALDSIRNAGKPLKVTLVLLPGMDGTGLMFSPFIAALGSWFTLTVVSYPTTQPMGYAELEELARAAMPTNEPFVLLGESFSGPIAISLAAMAPPNFIGLVLCCTFVRSPRPQLAVLRPLVTMLPVGATPAKLVHWAVLGRFSTPALCSAIDNAVAQVSPFVMRERLLSIMSVDVSDKLAAVTVPMLYLRALHDRLVPAAATRLVALLRPDLRIVEVDAPHGFLQAAPSQAAQLVEAFVREVQDASSIR